MADANGRCELAQLLLDMAKRYQDREQTVYASWMQEASEALLAADADLRNARQALAFYANPDLYASLSFSKGPGTMPVLQSDGGAAARNALERMKP
jgi:hypothetical protein